MSKNLREIEKNLRTFAKRCKNVKYTKELLFSFLLMGMLSFSDTTLSSQLESTENAIKQSRKELNISIKDMHMAFKTAKKENNRLLRNSTLELIQLMEQGDQVVKSPWSSWQFGMGYSYSNWRGIYKGRGDKKEKYPYEGIFKRSNDLFLRNISPESDAYERYTASSTENFDNPATTSDRKKRKNLNDSYGLESTSDQQEPIAQIELGASVRPREIVKNPITVTPPRITVNTVRPLNTPVAPTPPAAPNIGIDKFNPVAPDDITVSLPKPPTFNIKLGSYRNYMEQNTLGQIDGGRHSGDGKSYNSSSNADIDGNTLNYTAIYAWASPSTALRGAQGFNSALLKAYFDYTNRGGTGGGTATVRGNITIDSIRGNINDSDPGARPWNNQPFLVGGSRVATLDNANGGGTIVNRATVNMVGPLVTGYEIQNDDAGSGKREVINEGELTDRAEEGYRGTEGLGGLHVGKAGGQTEASNSTNLKLAPYLGGNEYPRGVDISRTPDIVDGAGNVLKRGGYTGYKIGLILTQEFDDPNPGNNYYRLINNGKISFMGKSSIGIQVYAKPTNSPNTVIDVINGEGTGSKEITMGGIESYGMKLSSRILQSAAGRSSVFENRGTINISGGDGSGSSLSSGMAVLEDNDMTSNKAIRAYTGMVKNKGTINVSGGTGNSGMILKVKDNDDVTNDTGGTINVTGTKNIGMRVDLGSVVTENSPANITPKAINKGTININDGDGNIGMAANNSEKNAAGEITHKAVAENTKDILFNNTSKNGIGMFSQDGGEIVNKGNIKGIGDKLEKTIGMVIQKALTTAGNNNTASSGVNAGKIELRGKQVTGVFNQGKFTMTGGSILTSGEKSISLYAKGTTATTKIVKGDITAENKALGLYADNTEIELGDAANANTVNLTAKGAGTLLFYNYTKNAGGTYTPSGKFKLLNNISGTIKDGATAFYYRDSATAATISQRLNDMFNDTGSTAGKKLKLKMEDNSTLFVLENTTPSTTAINLSSVDPSQINNYLGKRVEIDSTSSKNFKAYKVSKGTLNIDSDVNLDNHSGAAIDKYYRVEFINSAVTIASGKKISGTDSGKLDQVIAQANYEGAMSRDNINVVNEGTIDYSKKGATGIVVDYGKATNKGLIKMDADNGNNQNSTALFGASDSLLLNDTTGTIQLGNKGVGIWGANKIGSSIGTWSKNINITNKGKIAGINGKKGLFGIYADNKEAGATSTISHTGTIDFSKVTSSTGIYAVKGKVTSSGNISVKEGSVGINAKNSEVEINGGTYTIGKNSAGFNLTTDSGTSKFIGNSGNISLAGKGSVAYLIKGGSYNSSSNFKDNLTLTSTDGYTYMSITEAFMQYKNTKVINNDDSLFVNAKNSTVNLDNGTDISSTKNRVTGIYSDGGVASNNGKISLTGDKSSALYGKDASMANGIDGKITIGTNGSGIYTVDGNGHNNGQITVGSGSVGMRAENGNVYNRATGKIESTGENAIGMSQSGNSGEIENHGNINLVGDKSIGMHSEGATNAGHTMLNKGNVTVGDSTRADSPSIGIYSNNGLNSTIRNEGKVQAGARSTGIYGRNVTLTSSSETTAGDGGIGVYSKEGTVNIEQNAKISVGKSLGASQEGAGVYLAGNGQTLNSDTDKMTIGKGSFGYVMTGQGNTVRTGLLGTTGVTTLSDDSVFMYSADRTGTITNYSNLRSTGSLNYGIYASGEVKNYGTIDFRRGIGNVGAYSYVKGGTSTPKAIKNYGIINVSGSDISTNPDDKKYGIGMAAGYSEESPAGSGNKVTRGIGNIENHGIIRVTTPNSIGMYATGKGSRILNGVNGRIELSGSKRNIGIFAENGAEVINEGTITTVGTGNVGQIGIAVTSGATLDNRGKIHIDASKGYGLLVAGGIIKNYGEFNITTGSGANKIKEVKAADTSKTLGDAGLDRIRMYAPAGSSNATITRNGQIQKPHLARVQAIANRKPSEIPTSSVGMYIDTSGINYTKPINNIGALAGLTQGDLILGSEATKYTNAKDIQLGDDIIKPYNDMIRRSGIEKWSIYSGALTWMATITQLPDYTIRNAYLSKIPYTVFAGDKKTTRDTYNFTDGLEQRYGVEALDSREKALFNKLNKIGNNERILLQQAFDEMMGHQYANVQQRVSSTGQTLDKEINGLRKNWNNKSKQSNKIAAFGSRGEYKTDTAGIIDYTSNAYGVAYVHEDETIKLGNSSGWYAGAVTNIFKLKDIGRSKETTTMLKLGVFKSKAFDHNGSLQWTVSGEGYIARSDMHRKYLVVDEIFNAKAGYNTYGVAVKNEISKEFRTGEKFSIRPYGNLKLEYGRFDSIKEKAGEVRLEVKGNDYYSVKPEVGIEFKYKQPMAVKTTFTTTLGLGYENELGKVGNVKNKARVAYTKADWFNIRGEKDDRKGNFKADLNLGLENQRFGVTLNAGYDTKGKNIRGGLGFRVIY
ncbi:autotransporter-associated N-terminal domain-containing protein [Pseudoleptotrichia goodfellowii]|nr:autotransporter-associated N-terminal domain-containing protein [Pseudoleptotrichia goodfellowii]